MVKSLNKKLFRDLFKLKGQVITIALVVCSGISVLISSFSTYQSLSQAQQTFYSDYHFAHVFASLKRAPVSMHKRIEEIPGVSQVETRIVEDVTLDLPWLQEPAIGRFISIPDARPSHLNQLFLRKGRFLEAGKANEILVNEGFAEAHSIKPGDHIYALLNGHRQLLRIVGIVLSPEYVYAIRGEDLLPDNKHFGVFWMNHKALSAAFGMQEGFNDISLTLAPNASEQLVRNKLEQLFLDYGLSITYPRKEQVSDRFVTNEIKQQKIIASVIPPIFLIVASFLLNLVTGRLVQNQREQIALLKALGYTNTSIILYYAKLVLVIVFCGAILGISLGAWFGQLMTQLYAEYFRFPIFNYSFSIQAAIIGVLVSLFSAGSGALRSIHQVVNLAPAVAMRPPAPPIYRTLRLEQIGFISRCSASAKMFYRHTFRHLLRTVITSVGIALAMSIVILGLFWQDAINYLIKTQFLMSQKNDATVSFTQQVQDNVLVELRHIKGILNSEGYRLSPALLSHQNYSEQTALYGIPSDAKLKIILDDHKNPISIPEHALVLSQGLAERLHARLGDWIHINMLEGNRAKTRLEVQGIVNDYVGMFAYTNIRLMNRIQNEDHLINRAGISIDPQYMNQLYKEIKQIPKVSSITFNNSIVQTFKETFAKHILVFTSILTGFALVIAIAVVYNNAIIILAERSWELSTLRVLGFTEQEVSKILFYTIILEVLLAIPMGILFGYWISWSILELMQTDWFKIPFIIEAKTYAISIIVVVVSSIISMLIIKKRVQQLNLTAVLKVGD
ncbi:ABC transporter permease [Legionella sp. km535]|uniref:ABC transporter permease n=1 Tax=Legionella sp. km535 TaxID=2498107 RepID=UPI000F8CA02F|nr:FtsX-like permease family protein [Legionella sp. km535]RUR16257.1 ABC transporter permease [Legionella sp. km535]